MPQAASLGALPKDLDVFEGWNYFTRVPISLA